MARAVTLNCRRLHVLTCCCRLRSGDVSAHSVTDPVSGAPRRHPAHHTGTRADCDRAGAAGVNETGRFGQLAAPLLLDLLRCGIREMADLPSAKPVLHGMISKSPDGTLCTIELGGHRGHILV